MKHHKLFDCIKLSFPDTWLVEREEVTESDSGQPQAKEAIVFNEVHEQGHLKIKCFQIATESTEQQNKLLDSVFAETSKALLGNQVFWVVEELQGEEEGVEVAIKRWLVCSMQKATQFQLLIFNYSVASASLSDEAVITEMAVLENAIKEVVWL